MQKKENSNKAMGQTYIKEMANKRRQKIADKLRAINEDNATLQGIEKAASQEQFQKIKSKIDLKNDQEGVLKLRELNKNKENLMRENERKEYNEMVEKNIHQDMK